MSIHLTHNYYFIFHVVSELLLPLEIETTLNVVGEKLAHDVSLMNLLGDEGHKNHPTDRCQLVSDEVGEVTQLLLQEEKVVFDSVLVGLICKVIDSHLSTLCPSYLSDSSNCLTWMSIGHHPVFALFLI
jgi:hypothetical protein